MNTAATGDTNETDARTGLRVPPMVPFAIALAVQHRLARRPEYGGAATALGLALAFTGASVMASALLTMRRAATTIDPLNPGAARTLVQDGPFRFTRNPIYLGLTAILAGHAIACRTPTALAPAAAFALWIDRHQIPGEETALMANFGDAYRAYGERVPRWLRRPTVRTKSLR